MDDGAGGPHHAGRVVDGVGRDGELELMVQIFSSFTILYGNDFTSIINIISMNHSLLQTFKIALALQLFLDTLSDVKIKAFTLLF